MEMAMFEKLRTSKRQREHANLESRRRADEKAEKEQFDQAQQEAFSERSLIDREAALNLTQLAQESPEIGLRADQVQNLINTLIVSYGSQYFAI